jgi:hypothetical protein
MKLVQEFKTNLDTISPKMVINPRSLRATTTERCQYNNFLPQQNDAGRMKIIWVAISEV